MKPIHENTVIQIEITNACHLACANCTRFVGHHRKPFFMELETVRNAIASLVGFPGRIGIMGGEPCLHPKFKEILKVLREMVPDRRRREFWTAGFKWKKYRSEIMRTFDEDRIAYNDHQQTTGKHQPLLVAIDEIIPAKALRDELIDNCWIQRQWSASITPKGAFFCEVAAAQDWLFDGPGGWPVEPGWWTREHFGIQVAEYCGKCSAAVPMETYSDGRGGRDGPTVDIVSEGNLERLRLVRSPKAAKGRVHVYDGKLDPKRDDWTPSRFRDFVAHTPEDVERELNKA